MNSGMVSMEFVFLSYNHSVMVFARDSKETGSNLKCCLFRLNKDKQDVQDDGKACLVVLRRAPSCLHRGGGPFAIAPFGGLL